MTAVLAVVFAFIGCDEEFTEIGGEIINNPSNVELREVEVKAYSQKVNSIQTNNLSNYILGVHNHPVFGESSASVVTQLALSTADPEFGENVQLDSVVMTIPYFSTDTTSATGDEILYELDSIYGDESFKLSVYETSYFLADYDPDAGFEQRQKYYSNQQDLIEQNIVGNPLYVNESFKPSALSITSYEVGEDGENDTITSGPAFRIKLPVNYFQQKIIDKEGSAELLNNGNFKNYLRSLFIKAESNSSGGSQILLNFNDQNQSPKISLYYRKDSEIEGETDPVRASFDLTMRNLNRFNTFTGDFPENITQDIQAQSQETGAENIYLKAQEGSMAVIELFPDANVLADIREEELLVNEAELTFYVNEGLSGGDQPRRLYLYDLTNNAILLDYALDVTYNVANPDTSLSNYSGIVQTDEDENGTYYTIRITNQVSNIINEDTDNVKLGLVIVPNINSVVSRSQQGGIVGSNMSATRGVSDLINRIPAVNSLTPTGTVLHGNLSNDEDKKLKLKIYYTNYN